ncbi:MAG: M23 family metallopeptidase [Cyanobacteria bacterium P01_D01_bin.105]
MISISIKTSLRALIVCSLSFILSVVLFCCGVSPAIAQSEVNVGAQILNTTFNQLPPFREDGFVPDVGDAVEDIGYDPVRQWQSGEWPADVLKIGDIDTGLGASALTLEQIGQITGIDLNAIAIENLEFLRGISLEEFLKDVPFLGDWPAANIPELVTLEQFGELFTGDQTFNEVIEAVPGLAELEVLDVFGELPVAAIPNLNLAQLADFSGIGDQVIANVPGLGDIPLGSFPIPVSLPSLNFFPVQDLVFGPSEYSGTTPTPQPVSGGTNGGKQWQALACEGGCAHIELTDAGWEGANWMTKAHRVKDGYGVLGALFDEAGAYRLPFGNTFALQVSETNEQTGTAEWGIAFRFCSKGLFVDFGCTAYFLEVPLGIETREGDNILTGLRDGLGGASVPTEAPPGWEELRPDLPSELKTIDEANKTAGRRTGASLCGDGPSGVKFEALAEAYHKIESAGSGDYGAIGMWVSVTSRQTGRALGKYQYMSYRKDVVDAIGERPGGTQLLEKARIRSATLSSDELLSVFPPAVQDGLFISNQTKMINQVVAAGYSGDRLLEVLAQMHFRGPGVLDNGQLDSKTTKDDLGTSLYEYGQRFRKYYREAEAKLSGGNESDRCGMATGSFIHPLANGTKVFSRYFSLVPVRHPVYGTRKAHTGDDIAVGTGNEVVASDSGVIEYYTQGGGFSGYGWMLIVKHGSGLETWYAHLSERLVPDGSKVNQGDVIGLSGGAAGVIGSGTSTGPHLHFEVRQDGSPINPSDVVDYNKTVRDLKA